MFKNKWSQNMIGEFNGRLDNPRRVRIEPISREDIEQFNTVFIDTKAVRKEVAKVSGKDAYILDMRALPDIDSSDAQSRAFLRWIKTLGARVSVIDKPLGGSDARAGEDDSKTDAEDDDIGGQDDEEKKRSDGRGDALLEKMEATEAKVAELLAKLDEANARTAAQPKVVYVNAPNPNRQKEAEDQRLQQEKIQTLLARLEQNMDKPAFKCSRFDEPEVGIPLGGGFAQPAPYYTRYEGQVRHEDQVGDGFGGPRDEVEHRRHQEGSGGGLSFFKKFQLSVEESIRALVHRPVQTATFKRRPEKRN